MIAKPLALAVVVGGGGLAVISDPTELTATIATALTTVIVGWLGFKQHRSDSAREGQRIALERQVDRTNAGMTLIDQLQETLKAEVQQRTADRVIIAAQATELISLRREMAELHVGVILLSGQLRSAGIEPAWPAPGQAEG